MHTINPGFFLTRKKNSKSNMTCNSNIANKLQLHNLKDAI